MGGNNHHRQTENKTTSASSSLFGFIKHWKKHRRNDHTWNNIIRPSKVWPSDHDEGYYVGEPRIDEKASDFIAWFHESRAMNA